MNSWPRPSFLAHPVSLIVQPGGAIDFSQWERLADDHGAGSFCAKARARVVEATAAAHSPLVGFLRALCLEKSLQALFQQVIIRFGAELQRRFLQCMGGRRTDGLKVKPTEVGDIFEVPTKLHERLAQNMESCIAKSEGHKYFSTCSDKAAVGGFNLQAGLIVLANGTAVVPPPQVRAVTASGGVSRRAAPTAFWGAFGVRCVTSAARNIPTFDITYHTIQGDMQQKSIDWTSPESTESDLGVRYGVVVSVSGV